MNIIPDTLTTHPLTLTLAFMLAFTVGVLVHRHQVPAVADPPGVQATVTRVIDADTVELTPQSGNRFKVRVLGIDSPETLDPRVPVQAYGPEATAYARSLLLGKTVRLVTDPTQDRRDNYGRTLGYLMLPDGRNYSVEAARAGAARSYVYANRPVREYPAIVAAEQQARAARRGLWAVTR